VTLRLIPKRTLPLII
jgi:acyl carrier protein